MCIRNMAISLRKGENKILPHLSATVLLSLYLFFFCGRKNGKRKLIACQLKSIRIDNLKFEDHYNMIPHYFGIIYTQKQISSGFSSLAHFFIQFIR